MSNPLSTKDFGQFMTEMADLVNVTGKPETARFGQWDITLWPIRPVKLTITPPILKKDLGA